MSEGVKKVNLASALLRGRKESNFLLWSNIKQVADICMPIFGRLVKVISRQLQLTIDEQNSLSHSEAIKTDAKYFPFRAEGGN